MLADKVCQLLELASFSPIATEFAELLPGLASGRWDMTTGLFISDERLKLVDFTRPIWMLPDGLLVAKNNPRAVRRLSIRRRGRGSPDWRHLRPGPASDGPAGNGVPPERIRIFATQAEPRPERR